MHLQSNLSTKCTITAWTIGKKVNVRGRIALAFVNSKMRSHVAQHIPPQDVAILEEVVLSK